MHCRPCADPEGDRRSGPPPLENHNLGFYRNKHLDPLELYICFRAITFVHVNKHLGSHYYAFSFVISHFVCVASPFLELYITPFPYFFIISHDPIRLSYSQTRSDIIFFLPPPHPPSPMTTVVTVTLKVMLCYIIGMTNMVKLSQ